MPEKEGYDVIRIVKRGDVYYTVIDFVEGDTLIHWLKYHPPLEKEEVLSWIKDLLNQIKFYARAGKNSEYPALNPYSVIVKTSGQPVLLDPDAKGNASLIKQMERRTVRAYFKAPNPSLRGDVYSLGKLIQFILAQTEPHLSRRETRIYENLIETCLMSNQKENPDIIPMIEKELEKLEHSRTERQKKIILCSLLGAGILFGAVSLRMLFAGTPSEKAVKQIEEVQAVEEGETDKDEEEIPYFELGLSYFLELADYEKSRECFAKESGGRSDLYKELSEYFQGKSGNETLQRVLGELEKTAGTEPDIKCELCMARGYARLADERSAEKIIMLVGKWEQSQEWSALSETLKKEFYEYLGSAYEEKGELAPAVQVFEKMLSLEKDENLAEQIYLRMIRAYEQQNNIEKIKETCSVGIQTLAKSMALRIKYIEILCRDEKEKKEVRNSEVKRMVTEAPELVKEEEFVKLQKEYKIKIEGGNVWVEKYGGLS